MQLNLIRLARYPVWLRLSVFLCALLLCWLPIAAPIYLLGRDPNLVTILTMALLFGEFLLLLQIWARKVYQEPNLLKEYGLVKTRQNGLELLAGLSIGLLFVLSLFGLEAQLGWIKWQHSAIAPTKLILEGLASALGIGLAEELVFRGWLLDELQRDYRPPIAVWVDATIFAIAHFIKPLAVILRSWPTFPALLLLGLTLVWAKRGSSGRLGLPIGLHAGLVWGYYAINVGNLVQYSTQVPEWIIGVDRHPLAGVMGLIFLAILAFWMRRRAVLKRFAIHF